jgi:hypothetical protein
VNKKTQKAFRVGVASIARYLVKGEVSVKWYIVPQR